MPSAASEGALETYDHYTDAVESALDAEDYTPLVRLVFDAAAASFNSFTSKQALLTRAPVAAPAPDPFFDDEDAGDDAAAVAARASDRVRSMRKEAAAPVISTLEKVTETRSAELSQICRGNAEEIVSSLQELDAMQQGAEELRARIEDGDASIRQAGTQFLNGLEQLQELRQVQSSVAASCQAVGAARQLLQLCAQAGRAVNANELYKAFCLLERAQNEFLDGTPDPLQNSNGLPQMAWRADGPARMLQADVRLHAFLLTRIQEMRTAIEQRAIVDFNNWLVGARAEARAVGLAVLRRAAWDRQRGETLLQQRRNLATELSNLADPMTIAASVAKPLPVRSAGTAKLKPAAHPTATALLDGIALDPHADVLAGVDMTRLHRCIQMHECLGKLPSFQEYYQVNRRMQLNNDLAAQSNTESQYQSYIAQLVGFFVIEDHVSRSADALSGAQADSGWDSAVSYLKLGIETAFETTALAPSMLAIKDLMLLLCSALGQRGYHVAPLLDALMAARPKCHALLSAALQPEVERIVAECSGSPYEVTSADEAGELSAVLGLPPSVGEAGRPSSVPFLTSFSQMVPELLRLVQRYVEDCAAYVWGLVSQGEVLAVVRQQRDAMLLQLPLKTVGTALASLTPSASHALEAALQGVVDIEALSTALPALDDYTCFAVRGVSSGGKSSKAAGTAALSADAAHESSMGCSPVLNGATMATAKQAAQASLKTFSAGLTQELLRLQIAAKLKINQVFARQLKDLLRRTPALDWLPEEPVKIASTHSQYVIEMIDFLKAALRKVEQRVGRGVYEHIGRTLMQLVGDLLMGMLMAEELQDYNLYSLFRLNDDVLALADFASGTNIAGMEDGLQEVIQFCNLMVTGRLEEILDGNKRARSYPAVDLKHLLVLLRKFREISCKGGHAHGIMRSRQPESFLKKKTADRVAKQLRTQLEYAGMKDLPA